MKACRGERRAQAESAEAEQRHEGGVGELMQGEGGCDAGVRRGEDQRTARRRPGGAAEAVWQASQQRAGYAERGDPRHQREAREERAASNAALQVESEDEEGREVGTDGGGPAEQSPTDGGPPKHVEVDQGGPVPACDTPLGLD